LIPAFPLALSIVSGIYGCLNMYHLWTNRREDQTLFNSSTGALGRDDYVKLFLLSGVDIIITIPINIYYITVWFPVHPWRGWSVVHSTWSQIPLIPAAQWQATPRSTLAFETTRWVSVVYGLIFFFFFGIGKEARKPYCYGLHYMAERIGLSRRQTGSESVRPHSARSPYSAIQSVTCDKSDSLGTPNPYIINAPLFVSELDSKSQMETGFMHSVDSKQPRPTSASLEHHISCIPPPDMSESDLELGGGMQLSVLKDINYKRDLTV